MIGSLLGVFGAAFVGGVLGVITHELSHYLVLRISRPRVSLDLTRNGRLLVPQVTFPRGVGAPARDVRIAAVAPAIVGVGVGIPAALFAATVSVGALAMVLCAMLWCAKLSKQDRRVAGL